MTTWYKAIYWKNSEASIQLVDVLRETDKCVFLSEKRRVFKDTEYECYFKTFDKAKEYLTYRISKDVRECEKRLELAQDMLNAVTKMQMRELENAS